MRELPRSKTRAELSNQDNPYNAKRDNPAKRRTATHIEIPKTLDALSEELVVSRCAAGNHAISRRFGIDLERWGYAMGAARDGTRVDAQATGTPHLG